ncbi:MAG: hypothetical protein RSB23_07325 [Alistipes sp.]
MYQIQPALYRETATRLCDAIDGENYFSGSITFVHEGIECRITLSVIVYRRLVSLPEGDCYPIDDLVPVWWEFHTIGVEGEELNDFCFSELKEYIL